MQHRQLFALAAVVSFAGCTQGSTPTVPSAVPATQGHAAHDVKGPYLYLSSSGLYKFPLLTEKPIRAVQPKCEQTCGPLVLDRSGLLIAIESIGGTGVFDAHTLQLLRTLPTTYATSVAVDRNDTIWIANCGGAVDAYAPGGTKRLKGLPEQFGACVVASDQAGNLYVVDGYYRIEEYAPGDKPGKVTLTRTIDQGVSSPTALMFGPSGDLFVANFPSSSGGEGDVSVFGPKDTAPKATITDGIKQPWAIAVDKAGTLYVASEEESWKRGHDGWVSVYPRAGVKPSRYIRDGVNDPMSLVLDPQQNLYVANGYGARVSVYAPGGSKPILEIHDPVDDPNTLAIGN